MNLNLLPSRAESQTEKYEWLKNLFARNPFYIISAGLLLYGIYRLSIDPKMFAAEVSQLFFNFGSFQIYEVLLVLTAIVLGRKQIWYDSALLVCLENLFVFIPFILVSQALLIEGHIAAMFCILGSGLVVARFGGLKKFLLKLNMPPKLLWFGGVLLLVNVGLPLFVKTLHQDADKAVFEIRGTLLNVVVWMVAAPALLALANLLPRPKQSGDFLPHKGYFPLVIFTVWTLVTCVHLYSIGYVYELFWSNSLLAPVLWIAAWTLWNRINDFDFLDEESGDLVHNLLLLPTLLVTFLAAKDHNWLVFFGLTALNTVAYARLFLRHGNRFAFHLALISGAMMVAGAPDEWIGKFDLYFSRAQYFGAALVGYTLLRALMSRNPKLGIVGAIVVAVAIANFPDRSHLVFHVAVQLGGIFLLAHSLRWKDDEHAGAMVARLLGASIWIFHSAIWLGHERVTALPALFSFSCALLGIYFAVRWIFGFWGSRVIPYAAVLVVLTDPVMTMMNYLRTAPTGLIAVIGSFILFAFGTIAALTKNHWNKNERFVPGSTQINKASL